MQNMAILMADLSGYSAMTEIHGAEAAALIIERYVELVNRSLTGESQMLERIGDQVVIISESADDILTTAMSLYVIARSQHHFLPVHAGMHYGKVLLQDGHLFGSTLNLTARIAASAKEGKMFCSADFINALAKPGSFEYTFHGLIRFKNILQSKEILEIIPNHKQSLHQKFIDPICHLELNEKESLFRLKRRNKIHHFCSQHCMNIFQEISKEVYFA